MLFKFKRRIEKVLKELYVGPGLSSTSPPNNSKTLYNHVDIHILVMVIKKKTFEFLLPLQVLCFITRRIVRSNANKK